MLAMNKFGERVSALQIYSLLVQPLISLVFHSLILP